MNLIEKIRRYGLVGSARKGIGVVWRKLRLRYHQWRFQHAPRYANPTPAELATIERDLHDLGIRIDDFAPPLAQFEQFQTEEWFPPNYHGGRASGVWDEKLLEHWIAGERLGLAEFGADDVYVDVAAASSPWAKTLRERRGLQAFAIDLAPVAEAYRDLPYYRTENATQTGFADCSVRGVSLHCAYEMFMRDDDTRLIGELARILKPGGKAVILPLYMHTHYCAYATPEYFGKGYSDPTAKEYVRLDSLGIPSSRKYDTRTLKVRVLDPIERLGMHYQLLALRNKTKLGKDIYCHFILEIIR